MTISDDDLYRHSSQFRVWSFTREDLLARKKASHERAVEKVSQSLAQKGFDSITPLSFEQEQLIIAGYANNIPKIVERFRMPSNVTATAISFFRKFYLINSVMDYHPKEVMCTATFLAFKAENAFVQISHFVEAIGVTDAKTILDLEFHLLESLAFTLKVQNALTPLHGFFLDMQTVFGKLPPDQLPEGTKDIGAFVGSLYDQARKILISNFATDASFLYTPPQIALAALYAVNPHATLLYIDTVMSTHRDFLIKTIAMCQEDFDAWQVPASDVVKSIDRKLHLCFDPERVLKRKKGSGESSASASASAAATPEPAAKKLKTDDQEP